MNNYEFCAKWVLSRKGGSALRVLDYGCGAGAIVHALRREGMDAYGCDVFYDGGDYSGDVESADFRDGTIRRMVDGRIPFAAAEFDVVVNNQVLEHVEDIDQVLAEIARVLKPGGNVLSLFPDRSVWREGHCGIPFLHWFRKGSQARIYYAALLRGAGLGIHKNGKSVGDWSRDFCLWLDNWTHYRGLGQIHASFYRHFVRLTHLEDSYFDQRCQTGALRILRLLPASLKRLIVTKLASLVFVAEKPADAQSRRGAAH